MNARDGMTRDFRLIDAAWAPDVAQQRLRSSKASYVLVQRREAQQIYFYVYPTAQVLALLTGSSAPDLRTLLDLHEYKAVGTVAASSPVSGMRPEPLVVMGGRGPVGILPPRQPSHAAPPPVTRGGGMGAGGVGAPRFRGGPVAPPAAAGAPAAPAPAPAPAVPAAGAPAPAPAAGPPEAAKVVARYLTGRLPATVTARSTFSMTVDLTAAAQAGSATLPFAQSVGSKVLVLVQPLEGLSVVGESEAEIEVNDPQPEAPVRFQLKADGPGTGTLRVLAFAGRVNIAALTLSTRIMDAADDHGNIAETARIDAGPRQQPDLTMCIYENNNQLAFELWSADASLFRKKFGPVPLNGSPLEYFRQQFGDIESFPVATEADRRTTEAKLARKGASLFNAVFPEPLRVLLWQLREKINTVQISSDEPWIPWEFCRLTGKTAEGPDAAKFFAEAFSVTRWLTGMGPPRTISLDNIALVVPGDSNLQQASKEKEYVKSLGADGRRKVSEVAATYLDVTATMERGGHDAWHFTGHAHADQRNDADQAAIELASRDELKPEDIVGTVEKMLSPRPFVFFNACQSAQAGLSLTGHGGWARRFIQPSSTDATASAFIGSYWSVYDEAACGFAQALYRGLLEDRKPIGEAARAARLAVRQAYNDPTWLAYTVYADPYATVRG